MSDEQMGFDKLEDAVAALVSERGPGRLVGAWEVMIETLGCDAPGRHSLDDRGQRLDAGSARTH